MDGNNAKRISPLCALGKEGSGELEFNSPTGLCLTEGGLLLVCDALNHRVQVLASDLSFICSIPCQSAVWGVSVDNTGNVHIAVGNKIKVFTISGDKVMEYGEGVLQEANEVAFLKSQSRYSFVTDFIFVGKVFVFDWSKDTVIHSFPAGNCPIGININQEGNIFVCCYGSYLMLQF